MIEYWQWLVDYLHMESHRYAASPLTPITPAAFFSLEMLGCLFSAAICGHLYGWVCMGRGSGLERMSFRAACTFMDVFYLAVWKLRDGWMDGVGHEMVMKVYS